MGVWDTTTPAGSANIRDGDDRIRELKTAIQEALKANDATLGDAGTSPGASPSTAPLYHYRGHIGTTAHRTALSASKSGLFYDTDTKRLYTYAGGRWTAISLNDIPTIGAAIIPATTRTLFYQAAAPTGWTRDTTAGVNDNFVSIVTAGSPGTTGGTHAASINIGAHTHTGPSHTHDFGTLAAGIYGIGGSILMRTVSCDSYTINEAFHVTDASGSGTGTLGRTLLAIRGRLEPEPRVRLVSEPDHTPRCIVLLPARTLTDAIRI